MSNYRSMPRGVAPGSSENMHRNMVPVSLDDLAEAGNRSQRRWAKKKISRVPGNKSGNNRK